jgi:clan AA aspartic protease
MISGEVNAFREAILPLRVRGSLGDEAQVEAVLDTGFTEYLTLPSDLVAGLGLVYQDTSQMILADGTLRSMYVFEGRVVWDDLERPVLVHEVEGSPLVGMSLLYGYDVNIRVIEGGPVSMQPIP